MNHHSLLPPPPPQMIRENEERFYNTNTNSISTSTSRSGNNTFQMGTESCVSPSPSRSSSKPAVTTTSMGRYNYKKRGISIDPARYYSSNTNANTNTNSHHIITSTSSSSTTTSSSIEPRPFCGRPSSSSSWISSGTSPTSSSLTTQRDHRSTSTNTNTTNTSTTSSSREVPLDGTLSYRSPREAIDVLLQEVLVQRRNRQLVNRKADATTDAMGQMATQGSTTQAGVLSVSSSLSSLSQSQSQPQSQSQLQPQLSSLSQSRPTIHEVNLRIDSDYFLDGKELERNVVIDHPTDRSYIYTTDLQTKWKLPEFLFLDVPNSTYAARACGQFITNQLVADLHQMVKPGFNKTAVLDALVKSINKSDYEVQNIYVPRYQNGQYHQTNTKTKTKTNTKINTNTNHSDSHRQHDRNVPVQAITARFRLRLARNGTNIHKMLSVNFMNGHHCARGILVFIPSMETASPADHFWGSLDDVERLPAVETAIHNSKMDKWCSQVAKQHGTYRGTHPGLPGPAAGDRHPHCTGPYSYHGTNPVAGKKRTSTTSTTSSTPTTPSSASKKKATKRVRGASTKKVAPAKKKTTPNKKTSKSAARTKTKRGPHKIRNKILSDDTVEV